MLSLPPPFQLFGPSAGSARHNYILKLTVSEACTNYVRGHSTTTWTNFDPILTPHPSRVDKRGHLIYPPPLFKWTKYGQKPSSSPNIKMHLISISIIRGSICAHFRLQFNITSFLFYYPSQMTSHT